MYQLPKLPGEWFGDISIVHEYVERIWAGAWPLHFHLSSGPLYHYLIMPIVFLFHNQGYVTYKIASVSVSLVGLVIMYVYVHDLFKS